MNLTALKKSSAVNKLVIWHLKCQYKIHFVDYFNHMTAREMSLWILLVQSEFFFVLHQRRNAADWTPPQHWKNIKIIQKNCVYIEKKIIINLKQITKVHFYFPTTEKKNYRYFSNQSVWGKFQLETKKNKWKQIVEKTIFEKWLYLHLKLIRSMS